MNSHVRAAGAAASRAVRCRSDCGRRSGASLCVVIGMAMAVGLSAKIGHCADRPAGPLGTIDRIEIGFAGHYKVGFWTPVIVTLTGGPAIQSSSRPASVEIIVPDGDGIPTSAVERGVRLAAGKPTRVQSCVKFGRPNAAVKIILRSDDNLAPSIERTFSGDDVPPALPATSQLILELGGPLNFGQVVRFNEEGQPEETTVAAVTDPASLPEQWNGYDGVDLAVLTTVHPEFYHQTSGKSLAAMHRWLQFGGRLLLSVGRNGPDLLAAGKPLAAFAPGRFEATVALTRFTSLENLAGASQRLAEATANPRQAAVAVAKLADVRGRLDASEGSGAGLLPLVVRKSEGFGELIFVAADLNAPPLDHWTAMPQLMTALVGRGLAGGESLPIESGGLHLGYNDLTGQLRAALDQFPAARLTPFWLIAVLAGAYILLLFPGDYLFRRRRARRLLAGSISGESDSGEWGAAVWPWIRFAVIVAGVSSLAWWLARQSRGDSLQLNQADVIDFDVETGLARGDTWLSVFSPASQMHAISLRPVWHGPHAERSETQLSWLGLPGRGFGGMGDGGGAGGAFNPGAAATDLPLFTQPYPIAADTSALDEPPAEMASAATIGPVPFAAGSSKCFTGEWINSEARLVEANLFERPDHQLAGTVKLTGAVKPTGTLELPGAAKLPVAPADSSGGAAFQLTDCVLIHDRWAYVIPHFSAAEPIDVESIDPQTADTYFTRRKIVGQRDQSMAYDRAGLDRARILEMMMFYRAAGGRRYVGLLNRYQQFLDLSPQLGLDRAILIGFGPPASAISVDGEPIPADDSAPHLTIYRFLLPVRSAS